MANGEFIDEDLASYGLPPVSIESDPRNIIIRGGVNTPPGMIEVNGELQPSRAQPQPLPSWFMDVERQREELQRQDQVRSLIEAQPAAQAARGLDMAMRLEGVLGFDADRKAGVPVQEALMKWGPKMYFSRPSALGPILRSQQGAAAFQPTEVQLGDQRLVQTSPQRFQIIRPPPIPRTQSLTPSGRLSIYNTQLRTLNQEAEDPLTTPERATQIRAERQSVLDKINALESPETPTVAPQAGGSKAQQRLDAARRLRSQHPDWTKDRIREEAIKAIP